MPYTWEIMICVISGLVFMFLIAKVRFEVINIDYQTAFYLRFGFIRFSLNYSALMNKVSPKALGVNNTVKMIKSYIDSYPAFKALLRSCTLDELLLVRFISKEYRLSDSITSSLYFASSDYLLRFLKTELKKCKKTFITINQDNNRRDFDFYVKVNIRMASVIKTLVMHPVKVIKFINAQKELNF